MGNKSADQPAKVVFTVTTHLSLPLLGQVPEKLRDRGVPTLTVADFGNFFAPGLQADGVLHHLPMNREARPLSDLVSFVRWLNFLHRVKPVVLCAGTPKASFLSIFAAWVLRVPIRVYVVRGLRFETLSGIKRFIAILFEKLTCMAATHVQAVSRSVVEELMNSGAYDGKKAIVLGAGSSKGVDIDAFSLSNHNPPTAEQPARKLLGEIPIICFLGRLNRDKGVQDLKEAHEILLGGGLLCHLVLAGPNDGVMWEVGRDVPWVQVLGEVEDTRSLLAQADVVCLPSYREGFPNVVLEAQAFGIPVVAYDSTGSRDAIRHMETGILVRTGAVGELAEALKLILQDSSLREKITLRARRNVEERFDSAIVNGLWADFYINLLSSKEAERQRVSVATTYRRR